MRSRLPCVLLLFAIAALAALPCVADASPGKTGYSGMSGSTCTACHSGGAAPTVTIAGPSSLAPGASGSYTLTITGGPLIRGACDIAASGGTLAAGSNTTKSGTEVVGKPIAPTSAAVIFGFSWTAPAAAGTYTIYGAGLSSNNSGTGGDGVGATTFTVTVQAAAPALSSIAISGAASVNMNTTSQYAVTASYSDSTTKAVTSTATYSLTPAGTTAASISTAGVLPAKAVTANTSVTVNASYTEGGVTKTATFNVTVTYVAPAPAVLQSIAISGAASVNMRTTASYTVTATYGSSPTNNVTASSTFSLNSTAAASMSGNVLNANTVTADTPVTINASYTEGGVTKTATYGITIKYVAPSTTGNQVLKEDFNGCDGNVCPNWDTISGLWSVLKPDALYSAKGYNDIGLVQNVDAMDQFHVGRIKARMMLTNQVGTIPATATTAAQPSVPNGMIIFSYVDASHYRYVRLEDNRIKIGQIGNFGGDTSGLKNSLAIQAPKLAWHNVQVDLYADGGVFVSVDNKLTINHFFGQVVSGRTGLRSQRTCTWYAYLYAWDDTVLPQEPVQYP